MTNQRDPMKHSSSRRHFLSATAASVAFAPLATQAQNSPDEEEVESLPIQIDPPRSILLSCKLTMITKEEGGEKLSLSDRLRLAKKAGFDGVDLDEAGSITVEEARRAVADAKVFVHNAINHAHWQQRLTSPDAATRKKARENLAHCIRVSHAAGGSGVLIVVGRGDDGEREVIEQRCFEEMNQLLPLAAALGQPILIENVWNKMFYQHDGPADQSVERFVEFIDRFQSPWVGLYYDIGNHWKYGNPAEWIRQLGHRCVKLDMKGFSRAENTFTDIGEGDLPWDEVRAALKETNFHGWATAEVGGGGLERLTKVREQMAAALIA